MISLAIPSDNPDLPDRGSHYNIQDLPPGIAGPDQNYLLCLILAPSGRLAPAALLDQPDPLDQPAPGDPDNNRKLPADMAASADSVVLADMAILGALADMAASVDLAGNNVFPRIRNFFHSWNRMNCDT